MEFEEVKQKQTTTRRMYHGRKEGSLFRLFIIMAVFASTAILTGCPSLPEGKVLGVRGDVTASGNVFRNTSSGWHYMPIGGEMAWTLSNTSDWQYISDATGSYYLNDTIPANKVTWNIGLWSKTPGMFTNGFKTTHTATDYIQGASGPNFSITFQNQANSPFVQQSAYTYSYVNVIAPNGAMTKCAANHNPPSGKHFTLVLQLHDVSGAPTKLSWAHCTIKEFTPDDGEPGTSYEDGCKTGKPDWGSVGPPENGNAYGDVLAFEVDPARNPDINTPGYRCQNTIVTKFKITSDNTHWYDIETAIYVYAYVHTYTGKKIYIEQKWSRS